MAETITITLDEKSVVALRKVDLSEADQKKLDIFDLEKEKAKLETRIDEIDDLIKELKK